MNRGTPTAFGRKILLEVVSGRNKLHLFMQVSSDSIWHSTFKNDSKRNDEIFTKSNKVKQVNLREP